MPLKKLQITPGVNREKTRYTSEGGWYECDKVRFRQSYPEKIGGWLRTSANVYLGVCRSIWSWTLLSGQRLRGIGTHLKIYVDIGGSYYDITPIRATTAAGDVTFSASNGDATLTVSDTNHDAVVNDFVTFSGAVSLGGTITALVLNTEYQITVILDANSYEVEAAVPANGADTGDGGAAVVGAYQINTGAPTQAVTTGWGASGWGSGSWGTGATGTDSLRIWNQANFGQDLIAGPAGGQFYIWDASVGVGQRMTLLSAEVGASDVPVIQDLLLISDISRFVFAFGTVNVGTTDYDPMLIRWSDQEDATMWEPLATNQAGDIRLSRGSKIAAVIQARQEILVWTDVALYSLQYLGGSKGWGAQLVGENISVASQHSVSYANGLAYWMGEDHFHVYSGNSQPLSCDLRRYIFNDLNTDQFEQIFSGANEAFHEIWWFYCSGGSTTVDRYVIFNYLEGIWYYGNMARTAWVDAADNGLPVAATYENNLVIHEYGIDDNINGTPTAINAFITSAQFDIDDGDRFAFVWRVIPDISFDGSTAGAPSLDMTLLPLHGSGSGYNDPLSEGGVAVRTSTRSATAPVEAYTEQLNIRIRGRQMSLKVESTGLGVQWQLGAPRIDLRPDGRR
jgi:hypothetical protein